MLKKLRYIAAGMALALTLSACGGSNDPVPVQRVDQLTVAAMASDRYAGMVVSENAVTFKKESDKTVGELLVEVGDQVRQGQKLFSYDTDELSLSLDKQELELDRLEAEIDDLEDQISDVKKELKSAKGDTKTQLNIQQRQLEMELTQAEYDGESLEKDIEYTKEMLRNAIIYSTVDGTVRSINEDNYEEYIVVQQTGAYRIKGVLNEMNMGTGIMEGVNVQIISRLNPGQIWTGVVETIDYENAEQNSYDTMYYGNTSAMTSTSNYPFYIALDSTDGLLLGQHVYIQIAAQTLSTDEVCIPESYLMDLLYSPEEDQITASVWAVGSDGKLEKRTVTLGNYDINTGSYQVLAGLDFADYVADPANPDCHEGAEVSIDGKTGFVDDSGLTPEEQQIVAAEIADSIENAEEEYDYDDGSDLTPEEQWAIEESIAYDIENAEE